MGSTNSSEGYVVSESVATKLVELGDLLCTTGDSEIGKFLKELCDSPDRIFSLRNALLQTATSSATSINDPSIGSAGVVPPNSKVSPVTLWLQKFIPPSGESLTDAEQTRLSGLFKQWAHETNIRQLEADALRWCEKPSMFCEMAPRIDTPSDSEIVGLYFDEYDVIENAHTRNRPRRRVILLETFLAIQREEEKHRRAKKTRQRQATQKDYSGSPSASMRSKAIRSIAGRLWGGRFSHEEVKHRQGRLTRMSRYGEKWSLIKDRGLLLGLTNESKSFEQQKWSENEAQAMNEFVKELPVYSIRATLENAMEAITQEWSRQVQDHRLNTNSSATSYLDERMNAQPTHDLPHVSAAQSPDNGMKMLLDAAIVDGYGTMDYSTNTLGLNLQSLGDQQSGGQLAGGLEGEHINKSCAYVA